MIKERILKMNSLTELSKIRKTKKLNYRDISILLGISKTYYWQLENGKRRLSYNMACQIAKIFKMKPDKLFYQDFIQNIDSISKEEHHSTIVK